MLQYLLNTTAIWLLSLLCFDLLLKRETYHGRNRAYLLLTMMAGILIPMYSIPSFAATHIVQQPLQSVAGIKTSIVTSVTPSSGTTATGTSAIQWTSIVLWIYAAGAALSLLFLLRELSLLLRYYRTGKKSKLGAYTIVETCRDHGPFSVGRYIFISSKKNYDPEQWQIVLQHEQMHYKLLHLADLLLVQSVQVVFWFHPLVYLYRHRLLMVHEYQADAATTAPPAYYGHFLLEQALLQHGPLPAHAFNRSPIKNRLLMLSKKASSKMAGFKYLLVAPVLIAGLICCAKAKEQHEKKKIDKNTILYKGNKFGLTKEQTERVQTINAKTGEVEEFEMTVNQYPEKMNGKKIYSDAGIKEENLPVYTDGSLEEKILNAVKPELEQLPDANNYTISIFNTIVDEKGNLVYFDVRGLEQYFTTPPADKERADMKPELKATVAAKVNDFLDNDHKFRPATLDGKPVVCIANLRPLNFSVSNHQVTYHIK